MSNHRGRPPGHCSVCRHVERTRAELLLAGGASFSAVSRKFGPSADALARHWRNHVSEERRAVLILGPVRREALAARVSEEAESVIDHYRAVRAGLYQLYDAALESGDRNGGALLARALRRIA